METIVALVALALLVSVTVFVLHTVTKGHATLANKGRAVLVEAYPGGLVATTFATEGFAFAMLGALILL